MTTKHPSRAALTAIVLLILAAAFLVWGQSAFARISNPGSSSSGGGGGSTFGYLFVGNATSTALTFSNGLTSGGATSISGTLSLTGGTTTSSNGLNLTGGCYAVGGTCLTTGSSSVGSGTQGQLPFYNGTGTTLTATSSVFLAQTGLIGVGTSSPFGLLSVNPNGISGPAFVIGSSTKTNLIVMNGGNVGIGTSSPTQILEVSTSDYTVSPRIRISGIGTITATSSPGFDMALNGIRQWLLYTAGSADNSFRIRTSANTDVFTILQTGSIGIGTTTPGAQLDVYTSVASTTPLLLESVSGGGCIILKDVAGTGYTQLYTQAGVLAYKVHTGPLAACN